MRTPSGELAAGALTQRTFDADAAYSTASRMARAQATVCPAHAIAVTRANTRATGTRSSKARTADPRRTA